VQAIHFQILPAPSTPFMTKPATKLSIAPQPDQANLSKGQRTFNKLVKEIEASRAKLARWQIFKVAFDQRVLGEHEPVLQNFRALQAAMVRAFDQALDRKGLTKSERNVLQQLVCEMAEHLIVETDDEELKAIYNKHSDTDFDAEEEAAVDSMKAAVEDMYGVDLGDAADLNTPEEILARLQEQMDAALLQREEAEAEHGARRKTAKQLAKEAKQKAEADQTSLSIREVYRKLASALHPDREPDAKERVRKTALMQRVNHAYEKKDLLQLLELQLEVEQIDAAAIANLSEDRLKHFNKILQEQLTELQDEIDYEETPLRVRFDLPPHRAAEPDTIMACLTRDIRELKRNTKLIEKDLSMPRDLLMLKRWIKEYKQDMKERAKYEDDNLFF
jgi:hypothetical protein